MITFLERTMITLDHSGIDELASGLDLPVWRSGEPIPALGRYLLVGISPYSSLDFAMLKLLSTGKCPRPRAGVIIEVFDTLGFLPKTRLNNVIPGIGVVYQTPAIGFWEDGVLKDKAWGAEGRDLFGRVLGLSAPVQALVEQHHKRSDPVTPG